MVVEAMNYEGILQHSALVIHNQMQLKAIEPTHGAFTSARQPRQGFMAMNT